MCGLSGKKNYLLKNYLLKFLKPFFFIIQLREIRTGFPSAVIIGSAKSLVSAFSLSVVMLLKEYDPRKNSSVYHDDLQII